MIRICYQISLFDSQKDYWIKSNTVFVSALALNRLCMHNEYTYTISLENAHLVQFTVTHDDLSGCGACTQISFLGVYKLGLCD